MASASLTTPSWTTLSRAKSASRGTCRTRTSCRTCREKACSCSAASTQPLQHRIGGHLAPPRRAPDTQACGQAREDPHDALDGGVLAMKERAESPRPLRGLPCRQKQGGCEGYSREASRQAKTVPTLGGWSARCRAWFWSGAL